MGLLFFSGTICGLLIVTLLFWYIFGHDFLSIFFKPRKLHEGVLKKSVKYVGGKIIRVVTLVFQTMGKILATPVSINKQKNLWSFFFKKILSKKLLTSNKNLNNIFVIKKVLEKYQFKSVVLVLY